MKEAAVYGVKGKITRGEWGDDLPQRSGRTAEEGQTVVRRFIMLEKLDVMTAIAAEVKPLWKRGDMIPF